LHTPQSKNFGSIESDRLLEKSNYVRGCGRLPWWAPPALALPALIPLANACLVPLWKGSVPTGFIQYDMAYYMACAREHLDQGLQLTYGNPYASYATPAIYSQPQILLLGILYRLGLGPGIAFNLFGLAALFFAIYAAIGFFRAVVGLQSAARKLALVCFLWGGGVLTAAGIAAGLMQRHVDWSSVTTFDIFNGWWMLNFGRNLVYPTEAYYHAVVLCSLLLLIRRRFLGSLALAALLSWSHPFAGLSLALTLAAYSGLELALRSRAVRPMMFAGATALVVCHLAYYWVFLNRFADHRALRDQWSLAWLYPPLVFVPALFLVGVLAAGSLLRPPGARKALASPQTRLFVVWFLVVFGLSQHHLVVKPFQPIHFTHGYDWTALFFLGAPALVAGFERLLSIPAARFRIGAVALLVGVLVLDNSVWLSGFLFPSPIPEPIVLTHDQWSVLDWLARNSAPPDMVVCADAKVSYLIGTYTRVRSWRGHVFNTPWSRQRENDVKLAFAEGRVHPEWAHMHLLYVSDRKESRQPPDHAIALFQNASFVIWEQPAQSSSALVK
jgi:hypothetical protein